MSNRKKKNIIIFSLCILLVVMGLGYALLSQTLNINGLIKAKKDWNIYIESITPKTTGKAVSVKSIVSEDGLSASFFSEFEQVGDKIEYTIHIVNKGVLAAKLTTATIIPIKSSNYIIFSTDVDLSNEQPIILPGKDLNIKVFSEYKEDYTAEESIIAQITLQLNFIQADIKEENNSNNDDPKDTVTTLYTGDIGTSINYEYKSDGSLILSGTGSTYDSDSGSMIYLMQKYITLYTNEITTNTDIYDDNIDPIYQYAIEGMLGIIDFDEWWNDPDNASIIPGHSNIKNIVNNYPKITSLIIGQGINRIGNFTFSGLRTNSIVTIPNTVTSIGEGAFGKGYYKEIILPSNATFTSFNLNIFSDDGKIETLTIPSTVTSINTDYENLIEVDNVRVLGDSTRFDDAWEDLFGNAQKLND